MNRIYYVFLVILLNSSCKQSKTPLPSSYQSEVSKIAEHIEHAFWQAEEKRIKEATKGKSKYTPWKTFSKEHEVTIKGIYTEHSNPPVYTAIIRIQIPTVKDAYYEFQFQNKGNGWHSTEAYMIGSKHQRNFYLDPYPDSKNLKEYFPEELKKLGAPIVVDSIDNSEEKK